MTLRGVRFVCLRQYSKPPNSLNKLVQVGVPHPGILIREVPAHGQDDMAGAVVAGLCVDVLEEVGYLGGYRTLLVMVTGTNFRR